MLTEGRVNHEKRPPNLDAAKSADRQAKEGTIGMNLLSQYHETRAEDEGGRRRSSEDCRGPRKGGKEERRKGGVAEMTNYSVP